MVRQVHDRRAVEPDPLRGRFAGGGGGARRVVEEEFRRPSRRLFDQFARGEMILLLSDVTLNELERAPELVRAVLHSIPEEHTEFLDLSSEVEELADHYIADGAIASTMLPDALHLALAASARADALVAGAFATWSI